MGDTISRDSLLQELAEVQDYLRGQGEHRMANMIDFANGYVQREPQFLKVRKTTNPDTARTLEYVNKKPCVAALVTDYNFNRVLFVRQYRVGCMNHIHEVVAGVIEEGQDSLDALFAELRQEVGIVKTDIASINSLGEYYSSVGWTNEIAHLYIVQLKDNFEQLEQQLDEEECLSYIWIDAKQISQLFKSKPTPIKTGMLINQFLDMRGE